MKKLTSIILIVTIILTNSLNLSCVAARDSASEKHKIVFQAKHPAPKIKKENKLLNYKNILLTAFFATAMVFLSKSSFYKKDNDKTLIEEGKTKKPIDTTFKDNSQNDSLNADANFIEKLQVDDVPSNAEEIAPQNVAENDAEGTSVDEAQETQSEEKSSTASKDNKKLYKSQVLFGSSDQSSMCKVDFFKRHDYFTRPSELNTSFTNSSNVREDVYFGDDFGLMSYPKPNKPHFWNNIPGKVVKCGYFALGATAAFSIEMLFKFVGKVLHNKKVEEAGKKAANGVAAKITKNMVNAETKTANDLIDVDTEAVTELNNAKELAEPNLQVNNNLGSVDIAPKVPKQLTMANNQNVVDIEEIPLNDKKANEVIHNLNNIAERIDNGEIILTPTKKNIDLNSSTQKLTSPWTTPKKIATSTGDNVFQTDNPSSPKSPRRFSYDKGSNYKNSINLQQQRNNENSAAEENTGQVYTKEKIEEAEKLAKFVGVDGLSPNSQKALGYNNRPVLTSELVYDEEIGGYLPPPPPPPSQLIKD